MPTRDFTLTPPRGTHPTVTYRAGRHDAVTHKGVGGARVGARAPVRRHRAVTRRAVSFSVSSKDLQKDCFASLYVWILSIAALSCKYWTIYWRIGPAVSPASIGKIDSEA
eukprot:7178916-Prymnesium_polylepis.1